MPKANFLITPSFGFCGLMLPSPCHRGVASKARGLVVLASSWIWERGHCTAYRGHIDPHAVWVLQHLTLGSMTSASGAFLYFAVFVTAILCSSSCFVGGCFLSVTHGHEISMAACSSTTLQQKPQTPTPSAPKLHMSLYKSVPESRLGLRRETTKLLKGVQIQEVEAPGQTKPHAQISSTT